VRGAEKREKIKGDLEIQRTDGEKTLKAAASGLKRGRNRGDFKRSAFRSIRNDYFEKGEKRDALKKNAQVLRECWEQGSAQIAHTKGNGR